MPAPELVLQLPFADLVAEPRPDEQNASLINQVVIENHDGTKKHVEVHHGMPPETLASRLKEAGASSAKSMLFSFDGESADKYVKVLKTFWAKVRVDELPTLEPGHHGAVPARFKFVFGSDYFRAIAKIALHYYLASTRRINPHDQCLDAVKNFIRYGEGESSAFVTESRRFASDIGRNHMYPAAWLHGLAVIEDLREILVHVRLFCGHGSKGLAHDVVLAKPHWTIWTPRNAWAHTYRYFEPVPNGGKVGVREIAPAPCRIR